MQHEVALTDRGEHRARDIVRRRRLAERLLTDTFSIADSEADSHACKFEHIISPELDQRICSFLGHPRPARTVSPFPPAPAAHRLAQRRRKRMPIPLDVRKKPTDVKVHVSTGAGIYITWSDAHSSHYDFPYLREHCPCATCKTNATTSTHTLTRRRPPAHPRFPCSSRKVTARSAAAVGNYAVQIEFTDGHATGIFSFDHLREICPCDACAREFRAQQRA